MRSFSDSYREAGVNIEAGYEGVKLMRRHVARTMIPGVVSDIGGFGGLFAPDIKGHGGACSGVRHRRRRHQDPHCPAAGQA